MRHKEKRISGKFHTIKTLGRGAPEYMEDKGGREERGKEKIKDQKKDQKKGSRKASGINLAMLLEIRETFGIREITK